MSAEQTKEFQYKGYIVKAKPYQLAESGQWTVNVIIGKHHGGSYSEKPYYAKNAYPTEEGAIKHPLNFGRQIIDGEADVFLDL